MGEFLSPICVSFSYAKDVVLSVLQSSPHSVNNQVLGFLVDLMENQKTMSHVSVWRGKDNITAPHLLCQLWRDEECRIGTQRDALGALTGTSLSDLAHFYH